MDLSKFLGLTLGTDTITVGPEGEKVWQREATKDHLQAIIVFGIIIFIAEFAVNFQVAYVKILYMAFMACVALFSLAMTRRHVLRKRDYILKMIVDEPFKQ